ncbi:MAG: lamin tail domain-containing protein [Patescibacteria group bacterium]
MNRRIFLFVSVILTGIFLSGNISAVLAQDIIPVNSGDLSVFTDWACTNCGQGSPSGNKYIIMTASSSVLISPIVDLSAYTNQKLDFKARTYGGVSTSSPEVTIKISTDSGVNWNLLAGALATTTNLTAQPTIDLSAYNSFAKIKFESLGATGSQGVGLDDIALTGLSINNPPVALISMSTTTAEVNQIINFDASASADDGTIVGYDWDLGNGATSSGSLIAYAYPAAGNFTVNLTVTDDGGLANTTSTVITINDLTATSTPAEIKIGDVVINEFLSYAETGDKEWVEFYNNSTSTIDLNGWTLSDNSSTTTISGIIEATGTARFLVWEFSSGKLNNAGDIITIKDGTGKIIDRVAYGDFDDGDKDDNAPEAGKNYTTARKVDGLNSGSNKSDFLETITPTKGLPNIITPKPAPPSSGGGGGGSAAPSRQPKEQPKVATTTEKIVVNFSGKIIINELLPNPDGDDEEGEFIELKNLDDREINLAGWQLADNSNKKYTLASSTITVGGFLVVKRIDSQIALNNSGVEAANLYSPDGKLVDRVEYIGPAKDDCSYSRNKDGKWQWSVKLTPGEENISESEETALTATGAEEEADNEPTAAKKTSATKAKDSSGGAKTTKVATSYYVGEVALEKIRELELGAKIKVKGVVAVEPGVLGSQIFYLAGSGIQVYCYKKDFPNLKPGDYIEVSGELSESGGERRIKITQKSDISILAGGKNLEPEKVATADVGEDLEGSLVTVEGEIIEIKGSNLYLDDGSGETKVYIKSSTGIVLKTLGLQEGEKVKVTGIISQTSGGYRLLPRYQKDLEKIGEVKGATEAAPPVSVQKSSVWLKYLAAIIGFLLVVIGWLVKKYVLPKKSS